ncbi:hypothetical protein CC2G_002706 [Coprinopsis cinerea AmutBmut pab1-1]|nr:hypothetical protein CC2G_002706 [Coprinopsis cinerea AmutBmut pab1-1]
MKETFSNPLRLDKDDRLQFLTLRRLCSQWRSVAFTTPELWRGIDVELPIKGLYYLPSLLPAEKTWAYLNAWFDRGGAGSPPLRIALTLSTYKKGPGKAVVREIFATLPRFLAQRSWVEVELIGLNSDMRSTATIVPEVDAMCVASSLPSPWTALHTLSLEMGWWDRARIPSPLIVTSSTFPALKRLYVSEWRVSFHINKGDLHLSHDGLEALHLAWCCGPKEYFAEALSHERLPSLQELILTGCRTRNYGHPEPSGAVLYTHSNVSVQRLIVEVNDSILLLYSMTFPTLQLLHLDGSAASYSKQVWKWVVKPFIERSTAHLRTLSIHRLQSLTAPQLGYFVSSIPTLETLHIDGFSRMFRHINAQKHTLPHLATIYYRNNLRPANLLTPPFNDVLEYFTHRSKTLPDVPAVHLAFVAIGPSTREDWAHMGNSEDLLARREELSRVVWRI